MGVIRHIKKVAGIYLPDIIPIVDEVEPCGIDSTDPALATYSEVSCGSPAPTPAGCFCNPQQIFTGKILLIHIITHSHEIDPLGSVEMVIVSSRYISRLISISSLLPYI